MGPAQLASRLLAGSPSQGVGHSQLPVLRANPQGSARDSLARRGDVTRREESRMPEQASKAPATSKKQEQSATESVEEAIRRCAYELYLERGGTQESEVDDWLRAEREILAQHQRRR